jgi:hypothetical protein
VLLPPALVLAHGEEDMGEDVQGSPPVAAEEAPIAGIPYEQAVEIFARQRIVLTQIEGVQDVGLGDEGIYVYAEEGADVPLAVEGLPVRRLPLMGFPVAGRPYLEAQAIFRRHRAALERLPRVQGAGLDEEGIFVYTDRPEQLPLSLEGLPVRAREPMGVAVNGIPVLDVEAIFVRAQEYFGTVPGVLAVRLGPGGIETKGNPDGKAGIYIYTTRPNFIPGEFEGVPIYPVVFPPPETAE